MVKEEIAPKNKSRGDFRGRGRSGAGGRGGRGGPGRGGGGGEQNISKMIGVCTLVTVYSTKFPGLG